MEAELILAKVCVQEADFGEIGCDATTLKAFALSIFCVTRPFPSEPVDPVRITVCFSGLGEGVARTEGLGRSWVYFSTILAILSSRLMAAIPLAFSPLSSPIMAAARLLIVGFA
ncbi:hypothetical protein KC338_g54 [Hortaea werneckii]|nr:hypothetical protein KC338_g54 [Hortaea werneckii]